MHYLEPILTKLGYNHAWLEYGLIDENLLQKQSQQYDTSDDKNREHYRYAAFRAFLGKRIALDDTLMDRYVHLAQLDEDHEMAQSALILLIEWPYITDSQLDGLSRHPAFAEPVVKRRMKRTRLLRQLRSLPLTDELFSRCVTSRDQSVQRELLKRQDISHQQVELLQDQGVSRAVRNIAKQKLHRSYQDDILRKPTMHKDG